MRLHPVIEKMDKAVERLARAEAAYVLSGQLLTQRTRTEAEDELRRARNRYERMRNYASRFICLQLGGYWK